MRLKFVLAALALLAAPMLTPAQAQPKPAGVIAPAAATGLVDINSATPDALATLPGVGDVRSKAIVAGRPYTDKTDLVTKKILTQSVFDGLKDKIALANINKASAKDLAATLPGIGDVRAAAIVKGRPYAKPMDLVTKKVLTQAQFDAIKMMVSTN